MDSTVVNREGVEFLLNMLPSDYEVLRIREAQAAQNDDIPLGAAEQFLLILSSINNLEARLRLWAFQLEFQNIEKDVCDPLMDLKIGLERIRNNVTFKAIISCLLGFGNILNDTTSRGFDFAYLRKVPEVKDTVNKHSLLYHLTIKVLEVNPNCSDLYSEVSPLTRASKTDFRAYVRTLNSGNVSRMRIHKDVV